MSEASLSRGIVTLAFGKARFIEMAKALARSLELHAPEVPRAVVTDSDDPDLKNLFTYLIPYRPDYGTNLRQKMHLDLYSPFDETLFIDSDCLALRDLEPFWQAFSGVPFGVPGWRTMRRGDQDEYFDVDSIMQRFSLTGIPKFNGGTYYFRRSAEAAAFFGTARNLMTNFKELGLRDFRGDGPNDESVYAIAMAIHGLSVTSMGEGGMWTPINSRGPITLDVIQGECHFIKEGRPVRPDIVHFATVWAEKFVYRRECLKLAKLWKTPSRDASKANLSLAETVALRGSVMRERIPRFMRGVMRRVRARTKRFQRQPMVAQRQ